MSDSEVVTEDEVFPDSGLVSDDGVPDDEAISDGVALPTDDNLPSPVELFSTKSDWKFTLESVIEAVVSLHYIHIDTFDIQNAKRAQATGFVVDAKKGYILTNRHVAGSGRFRGYCVFSNHEECDVEIVYCDPIHDFAFLHYDTTKIIHASTKALVLKPGAAQVGLEIRIVGNDSGQVLSIIPGVISRLDRNAPNCGPWATDFNTSYIQASSLAKSGSSGSPVIDIHGSVVALQAAGDRRHTSLFLPLQRVARALDLLLRGEHISRGTIQTQWKLESFDFCKRLGLSREHEDSIRSVSPRTNHMLVAHRVLPKGPADGKIQKGDLLLKVNGATLLSFLTLDDILDTHVGESIDLAVRRGNQDVLITVDVYDLHAITPNYFVVVAGAIFQDLSYQIARRYAIPCQGVYSSHNGSMVSLPNNTLIDSVNGQVVVNLKDFLDALQKIKDFDNVKITYRRLNDLHTKASTFVSFLRCWYPRIDVWTRDDNYRKWKLTKFQFGHEKATKRSKIGTFLVISGLTNPLVEYIANTIVKVSWKMQIPFNGNVNQHRHGHGIIVDHVQGLVISSRETVVHKMGMVKLLIAEVTVSAQILFLHPLHNYAVIKYDSDMVKAPVQSATLSEAPLQLNQKVTAISVRKGHGSMTASETCVSNITSLSVPGSFAWPKYRAINFEALNVERSLAPDTSFGIMVEENGLVGALCLLFEGPRTCHGTSSKRHGIQACHIREVMEKLRDGSIGTPRILDFEMRHLSISNARKHGVHEKWLRQIASADARHLVYAVKKLTCRPAAQGISVADRLKESDVIITLNKELVTDLSPFGALYYEDSIKAEIFRDGKKLTLNIPTTSTEHLEPSQAVLFCGAIIQPPHLALRQLMSSLPSEVYISEKNPGTPADLYHLPSVHFITHVNDTETPDLQTFIKEVSDIPDDMFFRLRTMSTRLIPGVTTIKKFEYYFPTKVYEGPTLTDLTAA